MEAFNKQIICLVRQEKLGTKLLLLTSSNWGQIHV